jgi:hypothetical protein
MVPLVAPAIEQSAVHLPSAACALFHPASLWQFLRPLDTVAESDSPHFTESQAAAGLFLTRLRRSILIDGHFSSLP